MPRPARICFVTNSDAGQINVHLATIHALLEHHAADTDVHLCSFAPARKRCPKGAIFHEISGLSHTESVKQSMPLEKVTALLQHRPTFFGVLKTVKNTPYAHSPYTPSQYISITREVESTLEAIKPDLVVIDSLFLSGQDAARKLGLARIALSPNAWKDNAIHLQGLGAFSWPALGTAWPYPLPLYLWPLNIILLLCLALTFELSPSTRAKMAARKGAGYNGNFLNEPGQIRLCMGLPQLELPGIRPPTVIPIGPILLPSPPLASVDPELAEWIHHPKGEGMFTITIALGSHWTLRAGEADGLLRMFAELLGSKKDVRIYAKIMRRGTYELPLLTELQGEFGEHRLRVVEWMKADPVVLLRTGKVDLVIHHGGSNSHHEALSLGIPQMAIASWFDCYDFAARIETLGIGKWGNRKAGPGFDPAEILHAIRAIIADYAQIKANAVRCADVAVAAGEAVRGHDGRELTVPREVGGFGGIEGRDVAAEWIYGKARSCVV